MKFYAKKALAIALSLAMIFSVSGLSNVKLASAASKKTLKLSTKSVTLKVKKKKTVKVKNKPKGATVKWSSKNTKIATVNKKGKITAKKAGKTKVICKVTYKKKVKGKKKKVTKKFTVSVKVTSASTTKKATSTPKPTSKPTPTPVSKPTPTPLKKETSNIGSERTLESGFVTKDNGQMRTDLTSADMMRFMGMGWNYGNSLEQSIATTAAITVDYCETSANNLALTQENVDNLKKYGFKHIRIPVAWSNMMEISDDKMTYTIHKDYLQRVEEVINYALNQELYVIINIHYDGDWWGQFGDADLNVRKQAWARYEQIWTQLAERYKDYSDRLIFESANEELGDRLNDDWVKRSTENKTGVLTEAEQFQTVNEINQKFVDIVRKSGGNNKYRYLLIAGFNTNIDKTCESQFVMPTDLKENGKKRLSISVHYYTPWNYCGGSEYHQSEGMAERLFDWGTEADITEMHSYIDKMKQFTKQGYGVIFGEFGVQTTAVDGIPDFFKEFSNYAIQNGMCPTLWDNGGWFDRENNYIRYDDISKAIIKITGSDYAYPKTEVSTGKPMYSQTEDENQLTLKYTWEGSWKKNGGDNNAYCNPSIDATSEDGKWVFHCNEYFYWSVIHSAELANLTQPYIRITCQGGDEDDSALQYASAEFKAAFPGNLEKCSNGKSAEIPAEEDWSGKIYAIDKAMLQDKEILWLSASNKPVITKIEIFDGPAIAYN